MTIRLIAQLGDWLHNFMTGRISVCMILWLTIGDLQTDHRYCMVVRLITGLVACTLRLVVDTIVWKYDCLFDYLTSNRIYMFTWLYDGYLNVYMTDKRSGCMLFDYLHGFVTFYVIIWLVAWLYVVNRFVCMIVRLIACLFDCLHGCSTSCMSVWLFIF